MALLFLLLYINCAPVPLGNNHMVRMLEIPSLYSIQLLLPVFHVLSHLQTSCHKYCELFVNVPICSVHRRIPLCACMRVYICGREPSKALLITKKAGQQTYLHILPHTLNIQFICFIFIYREHHGKHARSQN